MIPDNLYDARRGTTDSEAIFLAALADGLACDPVGAMARTLHEVRGLMKHAAIEEPLRLTAAFTNGSCIWAYRWASDDRPPSLYYRELPEGVIIASEPTDDRRQGWREVPKGMVLLVRSGSVASISSLVDAAAKKAA